MTAASVFVHFRVFSGRINFVTVHGLSDSYARQSVGALQRSLYRLEMVATDGLLFQGKQITPVGQHSVNNFIMGELLGDFCAAGVKLNAAEFGQVLDEIR